MNPVLRDLQAHNETKTYSPRCISLFNGPGDFPSVFLLASLSELKRGAPSWL